MVRLFHPANDRLLDNEGLLAQLRLMRSVFDSVAQGVSICDATSGDLPLVYVNPAFERMTGYSSLEVLGRNCRFLQRRDTRPDELAELRKAIREGRDARIVLKNYTKRGTAFWNELYLSPVPGSASRPAYYVGVHNDITARFELERRMEHMALHDSLTGLANRSLAIERLRQCAELASRQGLVVAVFCIGLDGFQSLKDRFGHESGEELLRVVGRRLKSAIRAGDCAARIDGDEFLLIVSDLEKESVAGIVRSRVMERIEEPFYLDTARIAPSARIGVSFYPRDGSSPERLMRAAVHSMYLEKRGRGQLALVPPPDGKYPE